MTVKKLCEVLPGTSKLLIKERPGDEDGISCVRYDVFDPRGVLDIPELKKYQTRDVLLIRPDMVEEGRLVIVLKERRN